MATQTVAFPDDQQGAGNLDLVRQSSHAIAERLQPRAKLRTCTLPSEHPDNELNDSQRIVRICAAMNVVLEFIRTAKLRDSELLISDGTEHIEARATLQSAVQELELLREQLEQLDKENLALRDEVDRVSMFEEIGGRMKAEQVAELKKLFDRDYQNIILELGEVRLADRGAVRFLKACEAYGMKLENCPAYVREWMDREKD
jgi:hypothetical protein